MEFHGNTFLVFTDAYLKLPEVFKMGKCDAFNVIKNCMNLARVMVCREKCYLTMEGSLQQKSLLHGLLIMV